MFHRLLLTVSLIAAATASAAAQERQWTLDASDEDAYLIFGVPESDDVGLSLWCPIQKGEINIFVPEAHATLPAGKEVTLVIKAGDETAEIPARTEVNEEAGATSVEARANADHPVFAAMLQTDRFRVIVADEENVFPLVDADLDGLLALCRKP